MITCTQIYGLSDSLFICFESVRGLSLLTLLANMTGLIIVDYVNGLKYASMSVNLN